MSHETPLNYTPVWQYSVPPYKLSKRNIVKTLLYFFGIFIAECSLLGISFAIFGTAPSKFNWVTFLIAFGTLGGSLIYFFRKRFKARCLSWSQYLWCMFGATVITFIILLLTIVLIANPNDKQTSLAILDSILLLYGTALAGIAHLSPSHSQLIIESTQEILKMMPGKQLSLAELIIRLQKEYSYSDTELYQYIETGKRNRKTSRAN